MKKILFSFLIAILFLQGCQNNAPEDGFVDHEILKNRTGTISSLGGVTTSNQGTHLLRQEDSQTVLLRSAAINLDDPKYDNKVVEVAGVLNYTIDNKEIMEVENIDILEDVEVPKEVVWKDYKSEGFGFSIKYTEDMKVVEKSDEVVFEYVIKENEDEAIDLEESETTEEVEATVYTLTVSREIGTNKGDLQKRIDESIEPETDQIMAYTNVKIGSQNLDAIKYDVGDLEYYIETEDSIYTVSLSQESQENAEVEDLFNEMVDSFKLLDENIYNDHDGLPLTDEVIIEEEVLANYDEYKSDIFKFSIKYPKNWYFAAKETDSEGIIRHYEFGPESVEESEGPVSFDIMSGEIPSGSAIKINGKDFTQTTADDVVTVYLKTEGSRFYRLMANAQYLDQIHGMAVSLQELE